MVLRGRPGEGGPGSWGVLRKLCSCRGWCVPGLVPDKISTAGGDGMQFLLLQAQSQLVKLRMLHIATDVHAALAAM